MNVIHLVVPPLRDRRDEIPDLVRRLVHRQARIAGRDIRLSPEAVASLMDYDWPENLRELCDAVERLVSTAHTSVIDLGGWHRRSRAASARPAESNTALDGSGRLVGGSTATLTS